MRFFYIAIALIPADGVLHKRQSEDKPASLKPRKADW